MNYRDKRSLTENICRKCQTSRLWIFSFTFSVKTDNFKPAIGSGRNYEYYEAHSVTDDFKLSFEGTFSFLLNAVWLLTKQLHYFYFLSVPQPYVVSCRRHATSHRIPSCSILDFGPAFPLSLGRTGCSVCSICSWCHDLQCYQWVPVCCCIFIVSIPMKTQQTSWQWWWWWLVNLSNK